MLRWPGPKIIIFRTGIVYYDLHRDHENDDVLLGKRMTRHVLTVEEILQFPDDYHTKGVLSLPYGDIVEPFEAWYSKTKKMSRIDYYNGKLCNILSAFKRLLSRLQWVGGRGEDYSDGRNVWVSVSSFTLAHHWCMCKGSTRANRSKMLLVLALFRQIVEFFSVHVLKTNILKFQFDLYKGAV